MAPATRVNLLESIQDLRGLDLLAFTTYTFDPIFFDQILWPQIESRNAGAEVVVFVDAGRLEEAREEFTDRTGRDYLLIPVDAPGDFHPKLILGLGEESGQLILGSHNLTLSGVTSNLEFTVEDDRPAVLKSVVEFVLRLLERQLGTENQDPVQVWREKLDELPSSDEPSPFLHNLDHPILTGLMERIGDSGPFHLTALSPFHGSLDEINQSLLTQTDLESVDYLIREGEHTIKKLPSKYGVSCRALQIPSGHQRLHAKIAVFDGEQTAVLVGSPNWTKPALIQTADEGNVEAALILGEEAGKVLSEFDTKPVEGELPRRDETSFGQQTSPPPILVTGARQSTGELTVHIRISRATDIEVFAETEEEEIPIGSRSVSGDDEVITLKATPGDERVHSVRVTWPEGETQTPVFQEGSSRLYDQAASARTPDRLDELLDQIGGKADVLQIVAGLLSEEAPPDEEGQGEQETGDGGDNDEDGEYDISPSRRSETGGPQGFWARFEAVLRGGDQKEQEDGRGGSEPGEGSYEAPSHREEVDERELMVLMSDRLLENLSGPKISEGESKWISRHLRAVLGLTGRTAPAMVLKPVAGHTIRALHDYTEEDDELEKLTQGEALELIRWLTATAALLDPDGDRPEATAELVLRSPLNSLLDKSFSEEENIPSPRTTIDPLLEESWIDATTTRKSLRAWYARIWAYIEIQAHGAQNAAQRAIESLVHADRDAVVLSAFERCSGVIELVPDIQADCRKDLQAAMQGSSDDWTQERLQELLEQCQQPSRPHRS